MVKPTKPFALPPHLRGKKTEVERINNTQDALQFMTDGLRERIKELRDRGDDLLALQAIVYLFSGNPVVLFIDTRLAELSLATAEGVRTWCMALFREHGGTGPEVIDRIIGPRRQQAMAANQALIRFHGFVETARKAIENAPTPPPAPGVDDARHERRIELIKLKAGGERELTPEEETELAELRAEYREILAGAGHVQMPSMSTTPTEPSDEEILEMIARAMESGKLPPLPLTTTAERARELYLAAHKRNLTREEAIELGIDVGPDTAGTVAGVEDTNGHDQGRDGEVRAPVLADGERDAAPLEAPAEAPAEAPVAG